MSIDTEVFGTLGLLAVGCQDGTTQVVMKKEGYLKSWSILLDGPISSVKLYKTDKQDSSKEKKPRTQLSGNEHPIMKQIFEQLEHKPSLPDNTAASPALGNFEVNLVCGSAVGYAVVFRY